MEILALLLQNFMSKLLLKEKVIFLKCFLSPAFTKFTSLGKQRKETERKHNFFLKVKQKTVPWKKMEQKRPMG